MIARPDIDTLLAGPLGAWLDEQALVRERAKQLAMDRWWKAAIVGGPLLILLWMLLPFLGQINVFLTLAVIAGGYAWGNAPRRKAIRDVKEGINRAIASALELDYSLVAKAGPAFAQACKYNLLPDHDRSHFEDRWHGEVAGRSFDLQEAHLRQRRGSGKSRRYVTVFNGAVFSIDFSREFHGTTLIERSSEHRGLLGLGGQKDYVTFEGHRLDYVDLVHPAFADAFCVFSDDQVEARYLVNPSYVERLIEVQRAFDGKNVRALFSQGDLVIAIETGNMFESGSLEAHDDRSRIERTVEQFVALANLAASLNVPERGYTHSRKAASVN